MLFGDFLHHPQFVIFRKPDQEDRKVERSMFSTTSTEYIPGIMTLAVNYDRAVGIAKHSSWIN